MTDTFWTTNSRGQRLFVVYNHDGRHQQPLALIAHGLNDVHDSAHMRALQAGFRAAGYDVLRWDATNSWGRSGGAQDQATLTATYADLEAVVNWAAQQPWWRQRFVLAGHSLGAAAALRYAATPVAGLDRLVLCAPVVAGRLLARRLHPLIRTWWWFWGRLPEPGHRGTSYRYNLLHDGLKYDGRRLAPQVQVPTLILAAQNDSLIPMAHVQQLASAFTVAPAELVAIPGAGHDFTGHTDALTRQLINWLPQPGPI